MIIYSNQVSKKTSKQKAKQKLAWEAYLKKNGVQKKVSKFVPMKAVLFAPVRPGSMGYKSIPSIKGKTGDTSMPPKKEYTGNKIIGIATMHKSNLVPIFSNEEAVDVARMRRG